MTNLKHELTIDDLIVEYMMYKVKNDYEPQFLTSEFMDFLNYFERRMEVQDTLYENEKLFQRFFERKKESDWDYGGAHMDMVYSEKDNDYIIKANYQLSDYDRSVINTYWMEIPKREKIRNIIGDYLTCQEKRKIDESIEVDDKSLLVGKYLTAEIVVSLWNSYISKEIKYNRWPEQCTDINKYLLEKDLAKIIGVESIKKELLDFYKVMSKRIAILYEQDKNLKICNSSGFYLKESNARLLFSDYEELKITYYKASHTQHCNTFVDLDSTLLTFDKNNKIVYNYPKEEKGEKTKVIENQDNVKKIIRKLDK